MYIVHCRTERVPKLKMEYGKMELKMVLTSFSIIPSIASVMFSGCLKIFKLFSFKLSDIL